MKKCIDHDDAQEYTTLDELVDVAWDAEVHQARFQDSVDEKAGEDSHWSALLPESGAS